jgi:hypothetical protein
MSSASQEKLLILWNCFALSVEVEFQLDISLENAIR